MRVCIPCMNVVPKHGDKSILLKGKYIIHYTDILCRPLTVVGLMGGKSMRLTSECSCIREYIY